MTVVAMTREMGSLGKDVASGLAERLNLTVVHHELVERHLAEPWALVRAPYTGSWQVRLHCTRLMIRERLF